MAAHLRSFVLLGFLLIAAAPRRLPHRTMSPHDWLQFNNDAQHSGAADDDAINLANVATLQPLFRVKLPVVSDGAPAYWSAGSGHRARHVLFFTATAGSLIAISALDGHVLWQTGAPDGPRWTTSSPAIDPSRRFVYSYALDGRVHKYEIATGKEVTDGFWPALVTKKGDVEKESSALTIATLPNGASYLYATLAGYPDPGDAGDYQGHVVAIRLEDGAATTFNVLCSDKALVLGSGDCGARRAGIWSRSGVSYDDVNDALYVVTSNGPYDGKTRWGDSVLRLAPDLHFAKPRPEDSYTPTEHATLAKNDLDLGSGGMAIAGRYGVLAGKDSVVRLVDLRDLSGHGAAGFSGGELQRLDLPQGGEVLTAPAVWIDDAKRTWVFFANDNGTTAYRLEGAQLVEQWTTPQGSRSSPVIANGVLFGAANGRMFALDAMNGTELWADTTIGNIHWESPIVANGAVYISDFEGNVYGWALPGALFR